MSANNVSPPCSQLLHVSCHVMSTHALLLLPNPYMSHLIHKCWVVGWGKGCSGRKVGVEVCKAWGGKGRGVGRRRVGWEEVLLFKVFPFFHSQRG